MNASKRNGATGDACSIPPSLAPPSLDPMGSRLPGPEQRPQAAVVIYDGQCRFCRGQVARLARWDRRERLAFLSYHDPECARRFPELGAEQLASQLFVVSPTGTAHGGAAALRYLARRLPRLWPALPLLYLPFSLPLWQWLYRQIAQRRKHPAAPSDCHDRCPH